jgi:4-amino-4-deoxy-L-arabinose transferase-like glycosyltransferase
MRRHDDPAVRSVLILGLLAVILAAAAFLRLVDLASNPGGLYVDEAAEALDAHRLLTVTGFHPIFFIDGGGREALFGYLVAGAFRLFGEGAVVLRATAATIGVAGVFAIWLLARRFGVLAGLAAAGWAAGSLWLICISRDGMRNTLVPLFGALCLASLIAWADRPRRGHAVLAGAMTALATLYTYQPLKLLPVLVLAWLLWMRRGDAEAYGRLRPSLLAFVVAFTVVAAPMLVVAVMEPASFFGRIFGVLPIGSGQPVDLIDHWLRTLGMFAVTGDPNPRHDVAGLPLLGWPLFAIAALGVATMWRARRRPQDSLILLSLPIFLLPPLLATEGGAPHFLRALGLAAPLAVTIGVGVRDIVAQVSRRWGLLPGCIAASGVAIGLALLAIGSGWAYISRPTADRYEAFGFNLVTLADMADHRSAVIVDDYSATVIRFLDASDLPAIVEPGQRIGAPSHYAVVFARSLDEIERALGQNVAAAARVVARDPAGRPTGWAVVPSP